MGLENFKDIHKNFENKTCDLYKLQNNYNYSFSRYILIRTLDKEHIIKLCNKNKNDFKNKIDVLYEELYNNPKITNDIIINFIREEYPNVRKKREMEEAHLPQIIENYGEVHCGINTDDLNDKVKSLIRDKTIKTKEELLLKIDDFLQNSIKDYLLWQYYNQATNDLIEHNFNNHKKIIPTLRKIRYVDFLVEHNGQIIPFDLKITHISDECFDLISTGLTKNIDKSIFDDYIEGKKESEIQKIKKIFIETKSIHLTNIGKLKKQQLLDILITHKEKDNKIKIFLDEIFNERISLINNIKLNNNIKAVEWWNYKYQGERLFKNNNRFFVFLAYEDSFMDARQIKGQLEKIKTEVTNYLDNFCFNKINKINYHYDKDKSLKGDYTIFSTSLLISDKRMF